MATPPSIQRFYAEDYRDAPNWFKSKFINTLNLFAFPVYTALNGDIDSTNLNIQYFTFSLTGSSTATNNTISFQTSVQGTIHGITVMQVTITGVAVPTYLTTAPAIASWSNSGNQISIQSITGLNTGVQYQIRVKVE